MSKVVEGGSVIFNEHSRLVLDLVDVLNPYTKSDDLNRMFLSADLDSLLDGVSLTNEKSKELYSKYKSLPLPPIAQRIQILKQTKTTILQLIKDDLLTQAYDQQNAKSEELNERINNIETQISSELNTKEQQLVSRIDSLQARITQYNPKRTLNYVYMFILIILIELTVLIVIKGWATKPTIAINYNVGEIIGGILAGTGIAVAGAAYAVKTLKDVQKEFSRE